MQKTCFKRTKVIYRHFQIKIEIPLRTVLDSVIYKNMYVLKEKENYPRSKVESWAMKLANVWINLNKC